MNSLLVTSTFYSRRRQTCDGPSWENLGIHVIYQYLSPKHTPRRFYREWIIEVHPKIKNCILIFCVSKYFFLHSYRYYRGYNNDPAYTSHSHGWSSGPTSILTFYLLGLTVTSTRGQTWSFAPHLGTGVLAAEGGFETPLGRYDAAWSFDKDANGNDVFNIRIMTPQGTQGIVKLPSNMMASYVRDGETKNVLLGGPAEMEVTGGRHDISWNIVTPLVEWWKAFFCMSHYRDD